MLITPEYIQKILTERNISINGIFHVGSHDCEEMNAYNNILGIKKEDIIWVDALPHKVIETTNRGIPNVYNAVITDEDDAPVLFNVSNNGQSSSIFEFGTHSQEHPGINFVDKIPQTTITIDTFCERNHIDISKYDLWNFDIQGAELLALKGAVKSISNVKVMYLEVNENELYQKGAFVNEIDDFLQQYHFKRVLTAMTPHGWGDAIYVLDTKTADD